MKHKFLKSAALASTLLLASQANAAYLNLIDVDWKLDPDGAGPASAIELTALTYQGLSFAESTIANGDPTIIDAGDTFTDYGKFSALNAITGPFTAESLTSYDISAEFTNFTGTYGDIYTSGTETFLPFEFDVGGEVTWFAGATEILTGEIVSTPVFNSGGYASISGGDLTGNIDIYFEITSAAAGYFFVDADGDGVYSDLFDVLDTNTVPLMFGFSNTTNLTILPTNPLYNDGVDALETALGVDLGPIGILARNTGTYQMRTIPEPGMLSLMGLAFLGLAGFQRRRRNS